ncbi:MAG: tRNA uridine-5-carboxymethylaminomethyl(34) synthesis enzyme MnmG [Oligoflexia bacterium]|nr:tRNA uridine-5-carboxymethylaminomethyl(34) synthesis enzyme MnmG [Oligoflexia bacterium]
MSSNQFDVIVVGAGHAGCEAALASARLGLKTAIITTNIDHIAYMSCNPAVGGLAKGHIVREIDALGGEMGVNTDKATIQFKRLNTKKGPAVRASRSQCDKSLYSQFMKDVIFSTQNLFSLQAEVKRLALDGSKCVGIITEKNETIFAKATVITTGTFMNGVMHVGLKQESGGRAGDKASIGLSEHLKELGFTVTRLKTGTPARLHKRSIDWSKTTPQPGDKTFYPFSRKTAGLNLPQIECFLSYTNEKTHEIIRKNLDRSPLYCGLIEGVGPRYCPSIEDKVVRFADKDRHQTFLEPEGLDSDLIYVQGMSTSLPVDVQYDFLRTIPGLENVEIIRPGYAVEYDFIHPTQLQKTLETKAIENLFLAGQVNGTSGYEEAAGQGFWAGVNAAQKILEKESMILRRDQAYLGVLIDDLVTKGTQEPYRMFTSRAEYRLLLREDNTLERLLSEGKRLGLVSDREFEAYEKVQTEFDEMRQKLKSTVIVPNEENLKKLDAIDTPRIVKPTTLEELLRREEIVFENLKTFDAEINADGQVIEKVEIAVKYEGYIKRQNELVEQSQRLENFKIPDNFNFHKVTGFSNEEREKLTHIKPITVGQASRISGVNPSAIQALLIHLKGKEKLRNISSL